MASYDELTGVLREIMHKLGIALLAGALTLGISACGGNEAEPTSSTEVSAPPIEASQSPNEIQQDAATAYRSAIQESDKSAASDGLTELWYDSDNALTQVVVQDPASGKFVVHDLDDDTALYITKDAMMPTRLLGELDGLIAGGADRGSVVSNNPGEFVITNTVDLIVYVTTYTLDSQGRISQAVLVADDEPLGNITFKYEITSEGKASLKLADETN